MSRIAALLLPGSDRDEDAEILALRYPADGVS